MDSLHQRTDRRPAHRLGGRVGHADAGGLLQRLQLVTEPVIYLIVHRRGVQVVVFVPVAVEQGCQHRHFLDRLLIVLIHYAASSKIRKEIVTFSAECASLVKYWVQRPSRNSQAAAFSHVRIAPRPSLPLLIAWSGWPSTTL